MKIIVFIIVFYFFSACSNPKVQEISGDWYYSLSNQANSEWKNLKSLNNLHRFVPSEKGYLWIKKKFNQKSIFSSELLSISPGRLILSDEMYLNGVFIGKTPKGTMREWNTWNWFRSYTFHKSILKEKNNELLIKLYVNGEGAIYEPFILGDADEVDLYNFPNAFVYGYYNIFVSFLFVIIAAYHLLIYVKRKKDRYNLYYAIFSIIYAVYSANFFTEFYAHYISMSYLLHQKLVFFFMFLSALVFMIFLIEFLRVPVRSWFSRTFLFLTILSFIIIIIPAEYKLFLIYRNYLNTVLLLFVIGLSFIIIRAFLLKRKEVFSLLYGFIPLMLLTVVDIITNYFNFNLPFLSGLGFPMFLGSIMFILAARTVEIHNFTDELNESLEEKVKDRTQQLQISFEEIKTLKEQQDGDYFLTSLLTNTFNKNTVKSENVEVDFFISQKKKFSFRKREWELGGDIDIAHSIELRGKTYTIFLNADAMGKSMQGAGGILVLGAVFHSIVERTKAASQSKNISPERWLKNTFIELQKVFESFNGTMLISLVIGAVEDKTGVFYYINAEHPWIVLYRDKKAEFIENSLEFRKLGTEGLTGKIYINVFELQDGDMLLIGSDGRDDIIIGYDEKGNRIINEDENLFLQNVEEAEGEISEIYSRILEKGELIDDLSLLRIKYNQLNRNIKVLPDSFYRELTDKAENEKISLLEKAYKENPFDKELCNILLLQYESMKMYSQAFSCIEKYLMYSPADNMMMRAIKIGLAIKKYESSIEYGERLRMRNPSNLENLELLINSYILTENYGRARVLLNEVIELGMTKEKVNLLEKKLSRAIGIEQESGA